jgi:hypothetical protein
MSLCAAISSFVCLVITLRSAAVVVIGFTQAQLVSITTGVTLQPALKLIVRISSHLNFDMGTLLCGLRRLLVLHRGLLSLGLLCALPLAAGLPYGVSAEEAQGCRYKRDNS